MDTKDRADAPYTLPAPPPPAKGLRGRTQLIVGLIVGAVVGSAATATVLAGNDEPSAAATPISSPSSAVVEEMPSPELTDPVAEPSPTEDFSFTELRFGEALPVVTDDGAEETRVTVERPTLAPCSYASIGCTRPETGDRVVQVEIVIQNTGDTVASWGSDYFVLEFRDGTQMLSSDGNA